jgi:hypothetical protein
VLQQKRAGRDHQPSKMTGGSAAHLDFISDTVEALLVYYNCDEARDLQSKPHPNGTDIEISKTAASSLSVAKAIENIPKDMMADKADSTPQDGRELVSDKHEVMGCSDFLKQLKANDAEWYDVLSDYCRQKCAQKKRCVKQAKIFSRSAILVKAAIASDQLLSQASVTWSRIYPEKVQEPIDSQLPKGNALVGWRVRLKANLQVWHSFFLCRPLILTHGTQQQDSDEEADAGMETASGPTPAEEDQTSSPEFLSGCEGEARVLCAVTSHAAAPTATACSGYMVEWLWLSSPPPHPDADDIPPAPGTGEDRAARGKGAAAWADARANDGLDFVPAADMHGGRFVSA